MKIHTFGDGFASGHIWPEWPQLLDAITDSVENYGHIGAGNEFIFNCAVKAAIKANSDDIFLVQWAPSVRFDKLLEDSYSESIKQQDPVYKDIDNTVFDQTWWSSSASEQEVIKNYHRLVGPAQAQNRSKLFAISLSHTLKSLGIKHLYFSTYAVDFLDKDTELLPWVDTDGMESYSQKFSNRGNEVQPKPIVHLTYLREKILPKLDITLNQKIVDLIEGTEFVAYDPDREETWNDLRKEIQNV